MDNSRIIFQIKHKYVSQDCCSRNGKGSRLKNKERNTNNCSCLYPCFDVSCPVKMSKEKKKAVIGVLHTQPEITWTQTTLSHCCMKQRMCEAAFVAVQNVVHK